MTKNVTLVSFSVMSDLYRTTRFFGQSIQDPSKMIFYSLATHIDIVPNLFSHFINPSTIIRIHILLPQDDFCLLIECDCYNPGQALDALKGRFL